MNLSVIPSNLELNVLASLIGGGFVAAFLHAALPTHWLPFVLVGRAQGWTLVKTLSAVATAGLAHIATTAVVGGLLIAAGLALDQWIAGILPHLSAVLLFGFGGFYLLKALVRRPLPFVANGMILDQVGHDRSGASDAHVGLGPGPGPGPGPGLGVDMDVGLAGPTVSHAAAFWGLVAMLAISPGEVLLPIYMSSAQGGLAALIPLTGAFALGTVLGMGVFTTLARAGASALKLERWARYEGAILGLALLALGVLVLLHAH